MKGFVSIFQHLGRFIRQISVVLTRNLTKRDNQHVWFPLHEQPFRLQILRNFVLQEPRTRKTCLTEPLRRIIEPLRRKTEPHCGITEPLRRNMIEPLRRNVEHHCEIIEPIMRNIWLHCETNKTLLRKIEHFCSKAKINCTNSGSLCGINNFFSVNKSPALPGQTARESSCQNNVPKSFSDRETIDVKAVASYYENSHEINIPRCDMIDRTECSSNERSITVYRLTARKICKQSKINGHLHARDREPSRIPVKKVIQIMRKRKLRQKFKRIIRKTIPISSKLFHSITNYKLWYITFIQKNLHSFYTAYFRPQSLHPHNNCLKNLKSKQYSVAGMELLLSGDIEMNPGPTENVINKSICFFFVLLKDDYIIIIITTKIQ